MPSVETTFTAKPRRRKPVAEPSAPVLAAARDTNDTCEIPAIKKLQAHLDKLQALYLKPDSGLAPAELSKVATPPEPVDEKTRIKDRSEAPKLPIHRELDKLGECIEVVARQLGIKKILIPYLHGVIKRIDRHYPKTGLNEFVANIVKKFSTLPIPIATRINHALANCKSDDTTRRKALDRIGELLMERHWEPVAEDAEWRSLYPTLMEFTSPQFKQLVENAKPRDMQSIDFYSSELAFQGVLGFAAFHDLQRQQLIWLLDYAAKVRPVAAWIYSFQNEQWDRELRKILHGGVTPATMRKYLKTSLASDRKKRWRKAKQSNPQNVDTKPVEGDGDQMH